MAHKGLDFSLNTRYNICQICSFVIILPYLQLFKGLTWKIIKNSGQI